MLGAVVFELVDFLILGSVDDVFGAPLLVLFDPSLLVDGLLEPLEADPVAEPRLPVLSIELARLNAALDEPEFTPLDVPVGLVLGK